MGISRWWDSHAIFTHQEVLCGVNGHQNDCDAWWRCHHFQGTWTLYWPVLLELMVPNLYGFFIGRETDFIAKKSPPRKNDSERWKKPNQNITSLKINDYCLCFAPPCTLFILFYFFLKKNLDYRLRRLI
jgi:hypothetical protein